MATFGYESFDNDEAVAWIEELETSDRLGLLRSTLEAAAEHPGDTVPRREAERAVAAAETVAVWHGEAGDGVPLEILDWVAHEQIPLPEEILQLARSAVERVVSASELAREWEKSGETAEWRLAVDDLMERLRR